MEALNASLTIALKTLGQPKLMSSHKEESFIYISSTQMFKKSRFSNRINITSHYLHHIPPKCGYIHKI